MILGYCSDLGNQSDSCRSAKDSSSNNGLNGRVTNCCSCSSVHCLLHLEPVESKVPAIEGDVSNLQEGLSGAYDVLIGHQDRVDEIDKAINYLFENIPEKKN